MLDEAASRLCVVRGHGALADAGSANGVKRGFEYCCAKKCRQFLQPIPWVLFLIFNPLIYLDK
jgi:hypothetical protein